MIEGHRWSWECLVRSEKRSGEWWFCQWSCLTLLWYNHTNCVMTQAIRARARGKVATELFIKRIQRRRKWRQLELPLLRSPSWKATRAFINWYIRWLRRRPRVRPARNRRSPRAPPRRLAAYIVVLINILDDSWGEHTLIALFKPIWCFVRRGFVLYQDPDYNERTGSARRTEDTAQQEQEPRAGGEWTPTASPPPTYAYIKLVWQAGERRSGLGE